MGRATVHRLTIVKHVGVATRCAVEVIRVVDECQLTVNGLRTERQVVHLSAAGDGSTIACAIHLSCATSGGLTALIHLLHKEVGEVGILVGQVGMSLEVSLHTQLLVSGQRIGNNPAATFRVSPLIGIGIHATRHASLGSGAEAPRLVSAGLAEHLNKGRLIVLQEVLSLSHRIVEILVFRAAGE